MPGFVDCPRCEFRDRPEVCHALAAGVKRLCIQAHSLGREDYARLIRERTLDRPEVSLVESAGNPRWDSYREIELCDFRYSSCGCLSKPAVCRQFGEPTATDLAKCLACVAE